MDRMEEADEARRRTPQNPWEAQINHLRNFPNLSHSFPFSSEMPKKKFSSSEEYFDDLRSWVQQAVFLQSLSAGFPYFLMQQQQQQSSSVPNAGASVASPPPAQTITGVECKIPPFWKRIVAEFIDFLLLFFVKIGVTYVALDIFNYVDLDTLDLLQNDMKLAYKTIIQISQDIVILEIIHRLVVCAFETFWLAGRGREGGSTPGKNIMGLRVISCESSVQLHGAGDERMVVVKPGANLTLSTAFLRALTKNFVLALLIPTSFAFIFFPQNRTGYDVICNTIVVEEPIRPHRE